MYARILVPTDGSDCSDEAIAHGVAIAKAMGAAVVFLFVMDTLSARQEGVVNMAEALEALTVEGRTLLDRAEQVATRAGVRASSQIARSRPRRASTCTPGSSMRSRAISATIPGSPLGFVFGPSLSIGNIGTNESGRPTRLASVSRTTCEPSIRPALREHTSIPPQSNVRLSPYSVGCRNRWRAASRRVSISKGLSSSRAPSLAARSRVAASPNAVIRITGMRQPDARICSRISDPCADRHADVRNEKVNEIRAGLGHDSTCQCDEKSASVRRLEYVEAVFAQGLCHQVPHRVVVVGDEDTRGHVGRRRPQR